MTRKFVFLTVGARALARLALAATLITGLIAPTSAWAACVLCSTNLIVNPGADDDLSTPPGGWTAGTGTVFPRPYNSGGGFPTSAQGAPGGGANYFQASGAVATITQTIDLSVDAAAIDAGTLDFNLSGFLGGFGNQNDRAQLGVVFRDGSNATLGSATIGPVTNAQRGNATSFLSRSAFGDVPIGTRNALVTLTATRAAGAVNDGYSDSFSLTVNEPGACFSPSGSGPILWLAGDNNGNDQTGNGHTGVLGSAVSFATGKVGPAFSFTGVVGPNANTPPPQFANEVATPDAADLTLSNALTFEAWVRPTTGAIVGRIIDKQLAGGEGNNGYLFDFPFSNTGLVRVIVGNTVVSAVTPVPGNVFSHVAATWDGATVKLYVNGVLDNSAVRAAPINPSVRRLAIGTGTNNAGNTRFTGLIDELKIYDRALSDAEIQGIVAAGSSGSCKAMPDLSITKTASSPALPGTTITWTITVSNAGPGDSTGYTVVDEVPESITNVQTSTPGCSVAGNTVTCLGGPLADGEMDTITITGKTPTDAAQTVGNSVSLTGNEPDPTPDNNSSTSTSVVDYPAGICRGSPLRVLGFLELVSANPAGTPCATAANTVLNINQPIGDSLLGPVTNPVGGLLGSLLAPLASSVKASAVTGTSTRGFGLAAASANIAKTDVVAVGIATLSLGAVSSEAKSQAVAGCGTAVVSGKSNIASIKLTVLGLPVTVPVGSNPVTVPLLVGALYLNQKVVAGSTITQRAVFLDLPGTLLDVVIGEAIAGIGC
ncbi:MAG: LamG-like jellyroll fold domain-containing protein [Panacagrimonas sp.]